MKFHQLMEMVGEECELSIVLLDTLLEESDG